MKILASLFIAFLLFGLTANRAHTCDLHADEARKLIDAGTIVPIETVKATAMARHPDSTLIDIELERRYGIYLYQIELKDPQGVEWELELDASDGLLRKDHQDT
ncbi:PepSY domain-containing protein [Pseudomonas fitomaticsae]|uniref:PepSY domain-containing protein n=1 Tax=Pseudomonas fitomaticsae TaxID=2837969 RepID=A0ABY3PWM1_9PSED|nr:PepSY domain-containing protein [Pseudomonas fitomaticsae]UFP98230.1 PepSY domain-containing protein [Pseudomonas fitomaticsae]